MARVFSGIQPSGEIHLGNYLGAVSHWVAESSAPRPADDPANKANGGPDGAMYCVVDLHAITVPQDPRELGDRTRRTATLLLATGLNAQNCTLFVQSHVPAHAELTWYLNCVASLGELRRMTQFKEKSKGKESDTEGSVGMGLFGYPVLMAADILLYDTNLVPVGDDQRQHLELARDLAIRFNHRFGETLVVPQAAVPKHGARIMDLQFPTVKMSKSAERPSGTLLLLDSPEIIRKKLSTAVTDSESEIRYDPTNKPGVSNLLEILACCSNQAIPAAQAQLAGSGYRDLKEATACAVIDLLSPIQERYADLASDDAEVNSVLSKGASSARMIAEATLVRVRSAIGLLPADLAL